MRTGGYTVQQALTFEATSVVKQSISLAKRRGHAQVTPLHVASTMLSLSNGIFRTACLQSHSHPLQCKALELCFNVELNRLPVVSSRLSVPQSPNPTISNALVAAFKRAQANQRRGSIENQQQQPPLLVVKIELEQLIISILDDPSVSRVMREAGFLSTQVKSNIEQLLSLDQEATSTTNNLLDTINISKSLVSDHVKDEDVASVLEGLIKKRRSTVVVGECLVTLENVLKEVKDKFEKGVVPNELKEVKFISIPISFVNHIDNQEVNDKLDVLRGLVRGHVYAKGVVLYVGDLNQWMIDFKSDSNIVEHVIKELGKMVCEINNGENGNCWILGIATFGTFTRCRSSHHLLENRWGLHPITLPAGSLGLSLSTERESRNDSSINTAETVTCQPLLDRSEEVQISCCPDFMQRLEHNHQNILPMGEPCRKRNSICSSIHKESQEKSSNFSSTISSPFSSISISSYDQQFPYIPTFSPFSNTTPNSHSSSSDIMEIDYYTPRFKQFNSHNLDMLCNALEQKVPWQKHIILEISATILQCRSGMLRRKETTNAPDHIRTKKKEETWLLFCGEDSQAKERIAKELANVVFGTYSNFVSIALSSFSPTGAYSDEEGFRNKRRRDEQGSSCIRKIAQAISENPHRVIFVEGMVQVDMCSQLQIKRAIERGTIGDSLIGEEVDLSDAIIVLCIDGFRKNIQLVNLDLNISFGDENDSEDQSEGEIGIVESVDGLIVFRQQELHEELRL